MIEKHLMTAYGIQEQVVEKVETHIKPKRVNEVLGTVLWKDDRDGNGIIKDTQGHEYYFDKSATPVFPKLKRKAKVTFIPARLKPDNILVAREVSMVSEDMDEAAGYVHRNIGYSLENLGGRYWALVIINKENKEKFERHPLDSRMLGAVLDSVGAIDFDNWEGAKVSLSKIHFKQLGVVSQPEIKKETPSEE